MAHTPEMDAEIARLQVEKAELVAVLKACLEHGLDEGERR